MTRFNYIFSVSFCFASIVSFCQTNTSNEIKRQYHPVKIDKPPVIDGELDDACWVDAQTATDFIQYQPEFGKNAIFNSAIKLAYNDNAIYIAAKLFDPEPSKVIKVLTPRDVTAIGVADFFRLGIDTYLDGVNGYRFEVTPANAQADSRISLGKNDYSWDGVWESETKITDDGWVVELRIPYSVIRFPKKDIQSWGLQFSRSIQRTGEINGWSPTDPRIENIVQQWGVLKNLQGIKPPLRLSFTPFVAGYYEKIPVSNNPVKYKDARSLNGGMDIKWGLNESFTLDMTLIPDFGQVQSDNTVFNLSPFEVRYEERRPFFTEGTELFSKADIFYSRRIGARPAGYNSVKNLLLPGEEILKNPNITTLYNATKFSGRTKKGLGIAMLNAVASPMYATVQNTADKTTRKIQTGVLANQNILVLDQSLPRNSFFTFTNTSVIREGNARDANVSSLLLVRNDKKMKNRLTAHYRISYVADPAAGSAPKIGNNFSVRYEKITGKYQYVFNSQVRDNKWDPNDMGLFTGNNLTENMIGLRVNEIKKSRHLQSWSNYTRITYTSRTVPFSHQALRINSAFDFRTHSFSSFGAFIMVQPTHMYDYFEPRVEGKKLWYPQMVFFTPYYKTDSRKKMVASFQLTFGETLLPSDPYLGGQVSLVYRAGKNLQLTFITGPSKDRNNFGYVRQDNGKIIIGRRNVNVLDNNISLGYTLSPRMNINLRARHYWTRVVYNKFYYLNDDGRRSEISYPNNHDFNFNQFNVDCVYSWQFAPGSFLNLVWKNNITEQDDLRSDGYFKNLSKTFNTPQANSIVLKMIYYLEYSQVKSFLRKR